MLSVLLVSDNVYVKNTLLDPHKNNVFHPLPSSFKCILWFYKHMYVPCNSRKARAKNILTVGPAGQLTWLEHHSDMLRLQAPSPSGYTQEVTSQ